ncbi:mitochondrial import receptor protein [Kappamyces sp. JEL0829]|nr:mitochondrial import receptor protein [Kappamyces sp. JEL0829]
MVQLEEVQSESQQDIKKIEEIAEDDLDDEYVDEVKDEDAAEVLVVSGAPEPDDDEDFVDDESLLERIIALKDIVPPTTRAHFANAVSSSLVVTVGLGKTVGSGLWILATGALLVFLPVSLELERDGRCRRLTAGMALSQGAAA